MIKKISDRVFFQVVRGTSSDPSDHGPVVCSRWYGSRAPKIIKSLAKRVDKWSTVFPASIGDITACLVQECLGTSEGMGGVEVWSATSRLTEADSHGDAGVVLIDCANGFRCECLGGYLVTDADGFPKKRQLKKEKANEVN